MIKASFVPHVVSYAKEMRGALNHFMVEKVPDSAVRRSLNATLAAREFEDYFATKSVDSLRDCFPHTLLRKQVIGISRSKHEIDVGVEANFEGSEVVFAVQCKAPDFVEVLDSVRSGLGIREIVNRHFYLDPGIIPEVVFANYDARIERDLFYPSSPDCVIQVLASLKQLGEQAGELALAYGILVITPAPDFIEAGIRRIAELDGLHSSGGLIKSDSRFVPPEEILASVEELPSNNQLANQAAPLSEYISRYLRPAGELPSRKEMSDYMLDRYWDFERVYSMMEET